MRIASPARATATTRTRIASTIPTTDMATPPGRVRPSVRSSARDSLRRRPPLVGPVDMQGEPLHREYLHGFARLDRRELRDGAPVLAADAHNPARREGRGCHPVTPEQRRGTGHRPQAPRV